MRGAVFFWLLVASCLAALALVGIIAFSSLWWLGERAFIDRTRESVGWWTAAVGGMALIVGFRLGRWRGRREHRSDMFQAARDLGDAMREERF